MNVGPSDMQNDPWVGGPSSFSKLTLMIMVFGPIFI